VDFHQLISAVVQETAYQEQQSSALPSCRLLPPQSECLCPDILSAAAVLLLQEPRLHGQAVLCWPGEGDGWLRRPRIPR
jgi:hypothetical protein